MRPGKIVLLVAGLLVGLLGLGFLTGGGVVVWAHATQRDAAGFYTSPTGSFSTNSYALTSRHVDLGTGTGRRDWVAFEHLATVRVRARPTDGGALFVGIGPSRAVDAYLGSSAHDRVTSVEFHPFRATYQPFRGDVAPAAPEGQRFWVARAVGAGEVTLRWPVEHGNWTLVIMHAEAARSVRADVNVGAKIAWLIWLGVALLAAGAVGIAAGVVMVVFALRNPRRPASAPPVAAWPVAGPPTPTGPAPNGPGVATRGPGRSP